MAECLLDVLPHLSNDALMMAEKHDLMLVPETPVIEVRGTNGKDIIIDQ